MATELRLATSTLVVSVPSLVYAGIVGLTVLAALSMVVLSAVGTRARLRKRVREPREDAARSKEHPLYDIMEPYAESIKVVLQMFIGTGLAILISLKALHHLGFDFDIQFLIDQVYRRQTLDIVGLALGYSSALELAYALFTHGPDEAVDPLIMGLAAALLVVVSEIPPIDLVRSIGVALLVAALAGVFMIRRLFIGPQA